MYRGSLASRTRAPSKPADRDLEAARAAVRAALERLPGWEAMAPCRLEHAGGWIAVARDRRSGRGSIEVAAPTEAAAMRELAARLEDRAGAR